MRSSRFTALLILILWFGAAHHCLFEITFNHLETHSGTTCPAHSPGDSQEHSEGAPCSASVAMEAKGVAISPHADVFAHLPGTNRLWEQAFGLRAFISSPVDEIRLDFPQTNPSTQYLYPLVSPNAPPVSSNR